MHNSAEVDPKTQLLAGLGPAVTALRKAQAWSRRELAAHSGLSERFLAEIEGGRGNPSLSRLFDLATSLGTTLPALLEQAAGELSPPTDAAARSIALLGLRGAGKSSVGEALAQRLGREFVELDGRVEAHAGLRLSELFELHGPAYYRRLERQVLEGVLAEDTPVVLSTGGGLVTEPRTYALLQERTHTVWLRANPEDHWGRVVAQGDTRPMEGNDEAFAHLCAILAERERLYEQADVTVDTSSLTLEAVCDALVDRFGSSGGSARKS